MSSRIRRAAGMESLPSFLKCVRSSETSILFFVPYKMFSGSNLHYNNLIINLININILILL